MKKYLIIVAAIVLLISGCGKKEDIVNKDLAQSFVDSGIFTEVLEEITPSTAEIRYGLNTSDYSELTAFVGTKSNCDEVIIIKTSKSEKVISEIKEYINEKIKDYGEYRPDEVYKLTSPLILEYNGTVVVVISHDSKDAEAVYKEYLKS